MAETMILGLAWLAKWCPIIHWGKDKKRVMMAKMIPGPLGEKHPEAKHQGEVRKNPDRTKRVLEQMSEAPAIPREYQD